MAHCKGNASNAGQAHISHIKQAHAQSIDNISNHHPNINIVACLVPRIPFRAALRTLSLNSQPFRPRSIDGATSLHADASPSAEAIRQEVGACAGEREAAQYTSCKAAS